MKIAIAAEVVSFPMMQIIKEHLSAQGYELIDMGMTSENEPAFFFETAPRVARAIQRSEVERAILMCGTGMGVCILANKFKGVYACLAESATAAELHYVINRTNVLCMGKWLLGEKTVLDIVDRWLGAEIGAGFSEDRRKIQAAGFEKIKEIENDNFR